MSTHASAPDANRMAARRRLARRHARNGAAMLAPQIAERADDAQPGAKLLRDPDVVWRRFSTLLATDGAGAASGPKREAATAPRGPAQPLHAASVSAQPAQVASRLAKAAPAPRPPSPPEPALPAAARAPDDAPTQAAPGAPLESGGGGVRRAARPLALAAIMVLISGAPFGAQTGPFFAPPPSAVPAGAQVGAAMAPWPIGLTAVRRAAAPAGLPALHAALAAEAPGAPAASAPPPSAPAVRSGARVASAAPVAAPIPAQRLDASKDAAQSFFSDPIGFLGKLSEKERPEGADWSARRD